MFMSVSQHKALGTRILPLKLQQPSDYVYLISYFRQHSHMDKIIIVLITG